jgi:zinc transport system permease protein
MLSYDFMQRAFVAAIIIGLVAPIIGVHLVQRRLALLGDGMGHVALTGVGLAFLLGTAPLVTALIVAVSGAILIEFIRARSRTAGDLALALLFYGGIAGGVLLSSLAAGQGSMSLNAYLFGSISTVSSDDVVVLIVTAVLTMSLLAIFGAEMLSVSIDADSAAIKGIRVRLMSTLLAVLAAVTVVIGMRIVGLLLVSAIMIVPVAAAQQVSSSFRRTMVLGMSIGVVCAIAGVSLGFYVSVPPGPAIVLLSLAAFAVMAAIGGRNRRLRNALAS